MRRGEDARFESGPRRTAARTLRDRDDDVMSPAELAARHRAYYWRVVIGPSYPADMWAALGHEPGITAAELARRTYGSFATAWHVRRDYELLERARHPTQAAKLCSVFGRRERSGTTEWDR